MTYHQYLWIEKWAIDVSSWLMGWQRKRTPRNQHGYLCFCPKPENHMVAEVSYMREICEFEKSLNILIDTINDKYTVPLFSFCYRHPCKQYRTPSDMWDKQICIHSDIYVKYMYLNVWFVLHPQQIRQSDTKTIQGIGLTAKTSF